MSWIGSGQNGYAWTFQLSSGTRFGVAISVVRTRYLNFQVSETYVLPSADRSSEQFVLIRSE